jgi:YHS domain-containing protein
MMRPNPPSRPARSGARPARTLAAGALVATVALAGCAPLVTQSPGQGLSPVNAKAGENGARVMLDGHDVVAYFTEGRHRKGDPKYASVHKGVTFLFATADHKARFDANPTAYIPQYGGYCANGIAYAIPWGGDADSWRIIDGKLYIFGGKGSKDAFELDVPGNLKLAEAYWKDEVDGSNAFFQRSKRLVFKVPHYKSGEELAKMVAASRGGAPAAK